MIKIRVWETVSKTFTYNIDKLQRNPSVIFSKLFNGEDKLLKVDLWSGFKDCEGNDIYENDIVFLYGYGFDLVEFPFANLYEANKEDDIGQKFGNKHEAPELWEKLLSE